MTDTVGIAGRHSGSLDHAPPRLDATLGHTHDGGGFGRWDTAAVLTFYAGLLMLIPATQTVASLGGLGSPATMFSLTALLWFVLGRLTGHIPGSRESAASGRAMCVFAAAVLMAYIAAAGREASALEIQSADRDLILLLAWSGIVVMAATGIRDYARLDQFLRRVVVIGSIIAGLGIFEFATGVNLVRYIVIPGLQTNIVSTFSQMRSAFIRPQATTSHPLEYGAVLVMLLPFALQQAFDPARNGPKTRLRRWLPVTLIAATLPLTVSRTAMIGLVIVMLVLVPTWTVKRRRPAYFIMLFGAVAIKALVPGLLGTIVALFSSSLSNSDSSTQARTGDYAGVEPYIMARPWFGRGFGTFLPSMYRYTDNTYLLALVEMGLLGVLSLLVLYFCGMRCGRAGRKLHVDTSKRELGQSFVAAFGVALVTSATFDTLTFPMFSSLMFLLLGCAGSYLGIARREAKERAAAS